MNIIEHINVIDSLASQITAMLDLMQCCEDSRIAIESIKTASEMCNTMMCELWAEVGKIETEVKGSFITEEMETRAKIAYADGRFDAIDEFIRRHYACKNGSISCCHLEDGMDCTECIAEQMKGETDEKEIPEA